MTVTTGLDGAAIRARDRAYVLHPWAVQGKREPIVFTRAKGCELWDDAGKRYLDFSSQLANVSLGYQDERVVEALVEQARRLCYVSGQYGNELAGALGEAIARLTPGDLTKSYFTVGGSEANEIALQIARLVTGRPKILARWRGYHGATYGAHSVSGTLGRVQAGPGIAGAVHGLWQNCYRCPFGQEYPGCGIECAAHLGQIIEQEGADQVAALILEPFGGASADPPPEYLPTIRRICDRYGVLLIADEVVTGFGRTGRWFGCDHTGVVPDIMTVAKGMNSGYAAVGATVVSARIAAALEDRTLPWGFTNAAQPLGFAACLAVIDAIERDGLVEHAAAMGRIVVSELEAMAARHRSIGQVRGQGLYVKAELVGDRATRAPLAPVTALANAAVEGPLEELRRHMVERGLLCRIFGSALSILPPLCITEAQLREGLAIVDEALSVAETAMP